MQGVRRGARSSRPYPKLVSGGTNWLAVTGDKAGATYTVAGAKAVCQPCLVGNWVVHDECR